MPEDDKLIREFRGWSVEPSLDHYGTYRIPQIAEETENSDQCAAIDRRVARLIEAAPDLFLACRGMLEWIRKARLGTLQQFEEDQGQKTLEVALIEALGKALGEDEYAVCANCGSAFLWPSLDPIDDLRRRVGTGEPLPAGQCPDCGALCYDLDEPGSSADSDRG
jgi:hypothetical protein